MFTKMSTDTINLLLIIGVILLIIEVVFFHGNLVFSFLFSSLLIYVGWKRFYRLWGKIFFWIGVISIVFTILNMMAVRFLIMIGIIMFLRHYFKSKNEPETIRPIIDENKKEPLVKIEPLLQQKFFGNEKTKDKSYAWQDINIQGGFGDRIIDLSQTVLPNDAIISIRHFVGNVSIYVPYEVEVIVHHSSLLGRIKVFDFEEEKLMNQVFSCHTEEFYHQQPRVRIITSIWSGNLEVKRI